MCVAGKGHVVFDVLFETVHADRPDRSVAVTGSHIEWWTWTFGKLAAPDISIQ